jgi:hypothetical protein
VRAFTNKKLVILIYIFLITCFLFTGCGNKASISQPSPQPDDRLEIQTEKGSIDETLDDRKQADDKLTANPTTKAEKSRKDSGERKDVINQSSKQEKPVPAKREQSQDSLSVTISIVGSKDEGTILESTEVEIKEGDTVLDVLKSVTRQNKIPMSYRGKKSTAYVEGIDNLFEFDEGAKSGWLYRVNGTIYNKSAGACIVEDKDVIEWFYTVDFGKEMGIETNNLGVDRNE